MSVADLPSGLEVDRIESGFIGYSGGVAGFTGHWQDGSPVGVRIDSEQTEVVAHYVDYPVEAGLVAAGGGTEHDSSPERHRAPEDQIVNMSFGADLWVVAEDAVVPYSEAGDGLVRSATGPRTFPQALSSDPTTYSLQVDGAVRLSGGVEGFVVIQGDFRVLLWDANFTVDGAQYWSGQQFDAVASTAVGPVGSSRVQVLELHVTGGSVRIPLGDATEHEVFLHTGSLSGPDGVTLQNPRSLADDRLLGKTLRLGKDWRLWAAGGERGLIVEDLHGEDATLDGRAIAIPGPPSPWWAALVMLPVIAYAVARPPAGVMMRRLERRLAARDYEYVASRDIARLLRTRRAGTAALLRTTALLALGIYSEAALFLASLAPAQRPDAATFHFLSAHAAAGVGSRPSARGHLERCLSLEPGFVEEVRAVPVLAELLSSSGRAPDSYQ